MCSILCMCCVCSQINHSLVVSVYTCVFPRYEKERDNVCVCLWSSPLLYGVWQLHHHLCDADSFSVSLQTLPSACEEGCTAFFLFSHPLSFVSYFFISAAFAYHIPSCICICSSCVIIVSSRVIICVIFLNIQRKKWVKVWKFSAKTSVFSIFFSLLWALSCFVSVIGFFCCESMPSLCPPAMLPKCWISIWWSLKGPRKWRWTLGLKEVGMGVGIASFRKKTLMGGEVEKGGGQKEFGKDCCSKN